MDESARPDKVRIVALSEAQGHRCCYCLLPIQLERRNGSALPPDFATKEHVTPRSEGGTDDWENLVAACYRCNTVRGNRNPWWFLATVTAVMSGLPQPTDWHADESTSNWHADFDRWHKEWRQVLAEKASR